MTCKQTIIPSIEYGKYVVSEEVLWQLRAEVRRHEVCLKPPYRTILCYTILYYTILNYTIIYYIISCLVLVRARGARVLRAVAAEDEEQAVIIVWYIIFVV